MRLHNIRRSMLATTVVILTAASASLAAGGGLSVSPGIFEHTANPGNVGSLKISNTTGKSMAVKVALRPWVQSPSGEVSPNRGRTLGDVRLSASSFTLGAGSSQSVGLSLTRTPPGRSQYGGIEVTGVPSGRAGNGIKVAYRLVSSLRLDAPRGAQSFRARAGGLIEQGSVKHGTLLLAVRNTGNTIVPIGGKARISGSGHSLSANARAKVIVPGATVNVPLTELAGSLPRGRYTVSVALSQGGHALGTVRHTVSLR
ncbi:MAG: hypothetical protein ACHQC8_05785 [Solirubrobacterales bacterium]